MGRVKSINNNLDQNLNGNSFYGNASETIFTFGSFTLTSNFSGRDYIDYSYTLSNFVRPVTLDTMGITSGQSKIILEYSTNAVLNLDRSDLKTFVRFGSAYEFLRVTVENIIIKYPGSLHINSQTTRGGNATFIDFSYDIINNVSNFKIPKEYAENTFGLIINDGNISTPDNVELKNLNLSYNDYVIWSTINPTGNSFTIIGFTGYTSTDKYIHIKTNGNPFPTVTGTTSNISFHIKPNNVVFEEFRSKLTNFEKYMVSQRNESDGFKFILKEPTLLENGNIIYLNSEILWTTTDGYNIDINNQRYRKFLDIILSIGNKYDAVKTDLIARFLTPMSLKTYDLTHEGKVNKLLKTFGWEFDQLRQFIDSLVYINRVTYDKTNNVPDQLVKNLSRTFGWEYFSLVKESELIESFLSIDDTERNLHTDLLPAEIDVELWRRIIMNTNYFWKSKGTRESIKSIFLLIGIPEPFINITEYVYTVQGKINPNTVPFSVSDFPSNSLPYDTDGYPVAPTETNDFYFQTSGDTDSGQAYLNVFRQAGFNLNQVIDNNKSWIQTGSTTRVHSTTPQYYQEDSRLVINTKEIDVALDTARGIEYDVYDYIKNKDYPANSSGYTLPFSYVNISLNYINSANQFTLPSIYNKAEGDLEIRFNGILLNAPKEYSGSTINDVYDETSRADYTINGNTFTLTNGNYANNNQYRRDVIQATFIYSGNTHPITGITVEYIVARIKPNLLGTVIPLPSTPRGDVQVTINGIALTKGSSQYNADYIVDEVNKNIIIQNTDLISYFSVSPDVQVTYVQVIGSNDISARSEVVRVDSFNSNKVYLNLSANRYVYRTNYKINNASEVKVLINGIALEPYKDYDINVYNPYEIFLPNGIRYGTVISVYYLVGGNAYFTPVVSDSFGLGDISKLSFLEFLELVQRKMINARNRKTISDFKGGWYPTLLNIYTKYLIRGELPANDPLRSNGYTFQNLYSFLSKYNSFFQRFVNELLSSTVIMKKSGLLVRNSIFTKQKFMYKRGVNASSNLRKSLEFLGDDGSLFLIVQEVLPPVPEPTLFINTKSATKGIGEISGFGGININCSSGLDKIDEYGVMYRTSDLVPWVIISKTTKLLVDNFTLPTVTGLLENTTYMYRAYIKSNIYGYTGNTLTITTNSTPVVLPSVTTSPATSTDTTTIKATGGQNIIGWESVDFTSMNYRKIGDPWSETTPDGTPLTTNSFVVDISGLDSDTTYEYRAHMMVDGVVYTGHTLSIKTEAIPKYAPTVTTRIASLISQTGATTGGNVTSDGGETVTSRGVCWSLAMHPTTLDNKTVDGSGTGLFTSVLEDLLPNTTYFFRAYAINAIGISYGEELSLTTLKIPEMYFGSIVSDCGVLAVDNNVDQIYSITFKYDISAGCDNEPAGTDPNSSTTSVDILVNNVTVFTDSIIASVAGGGHYTDSKDKTGRTTITNISNVPTVKVRGTYQNGNGQNGGYSIEIENIGVNTGSVTSKCPNTIYGSSAVATTLSCADVPAELPTVVTYEMSVSSIRRTTATGSGNVSGGGSGAITARGLVWSTLTNPTLANSSTSNGAALGTFPAYLTNLTPNTKYYVKAYGTNSAGTAYGNEVTFTTDPILAPTLTTTEITSITDTKANSGGNITDDGGASVTERGVVYRESYTPTYVDNYGKTSNGTGTGIFTSITGTLLRGKLYYIRAYAKNAEGLIGYGNELAFTTLDFPTVTTTTITSVTRNSATSGGNVTADGGATVTERGICYTINSTPTTADAKIVDTGSGIGSYVSVINGLVPNSNYHVRAYAINSVGTSYGSDLTFTSPEVLMSLSPNSFTWNAAASGGGVGINFSLITNETYVNVIGLPDWIEIKAVIYHVDGTYENRAVAIGDKITALDQLLIYPISTNDAYRIVTFNFIGSDSGAISSITVEQTITTPTVTTDAASSILGTSATCGGNVTSTGGGTITARGLCWGTTSNPTIAGAFSTIGSGIGAFTGTINPLIIGTKYYVRAYATNSAGTVYGNEISFTTLNTPTVTTTTITSIGTTTASGGGNVTNDGDAVVTARGICWSYQHQPTIDDPHTTDGTGSGVYTSALINLINNKTYFVRAYATNTVGTAYGSQISFTTADAFITISPSTFIWNESDEELTIPSIKQPFTISTSETYAQVISTGATWNRFYGYTYPLGYKELADGDLIPNGTTIEVYPKTNNIGNVTRSIVFNFVKPYSPANLFNAYTAQISLTQRGVDVVSPALNSISGVMAYSATANVTNSDTNMITGGVCWSTSPNPTTANDCTTDGIASGVYNTILTGLLGNTTYYVRAYSTNLAGTGYGNEISFTTATPTTPTVTTTTISSIGTTTATGGGNVTDDGYVSVTARGICWSTSSTPTISGSHTTDGTGTGTFSSSLTSLIPNTLYYVRAYATNAMGTSYGDETTFSTNIVTVSVSPNSFVFNILDETYLAAKTFTINTSEPFVTVVSTGATWNRLEGNTINGGYKVLDDNDTIANGETIYVYPATNNSGSPVRSIVFTFIKAYSTTYEATLSITQNGETSIDLMVDGNDPYMTINNDPAPINFTLNDPNVSITPINVTSTDSTPGLYYTVYWLALKDGGATNMGKGSFTVQDSMDSYVYIVLTGNVLQNDEIVIYLSSTTPY